MSDRREPDTRNRPPASPAAPRAYSGPAVLVLALALAAALGFWGWRTKQARGPSPGPAPVEPPAANLPASAAGVGATNPPAAAAAAKADFQKLKGKWLRPDGGYVVEVKSVDEAGKMDAAYFNPRPIHVAKAEASPEGALIRVFIELRDVNYPGSTYTLMYSPDSDQLRGIYYQAAEQERFEVAFVRTP